MIDPFEKEQLNSTEIYLPKLAVGEIVGTLAHTEATTAPTQKNLKCELNKNKLNGFKKSDYVMKYGLLIGCHQGLSNKDILYIHSAILNFNKI